MTDGDLERLERELGKEEGALKGELGALRSLAAELEARARRARQLADDLSGASADEVASRLKRVVVPEVSDLAFERARRAREDAIKVRREATAQLRQTLVVTKRLLTELSGQLESDEREARRRLEADSHALKVLDTLPVADEVPVGATAIGSPLGIEAALTSAVLAARPEQRRDQRRVKMQTAVELQTDSHFSTAFSADLSEGGIFVATVMLQPLGTAIDLDFTLPSGVAVQARGFVRWVREVSDQHPDNHPGMGIQFTELDEAAREGIRDFVAQRDPMFFVD
ncbi:MAG: TIGR02266 family protein [Myxococcaceae bacterium]|nr:TIGR02266 family protein [Myxococcaceae bacterium]